MGLKNVLNTLETFCRSEKSCEICNKKFSTWWTRKRHLKQIHGEEDKEKKIQHIRCPLCSEGVKESFGNFAQLETHIRENHSVDIKKSIAYFRNVQEFERWMKIENKEVKYACYRKNKYNGEEHIYYNCNRSNLRGFVSNCTKRKSGGTIRIAGVGPSRILAKTLLNGDIKVHFVETHVGHDDVRTKRLVKSKKRMIRNPLSAGPSHHVNSNEEVLQIQEPTITEIQHQDELDNSTEESDNNQNSNMSFQEKREIFITEVINFTRSLDEETYSKWIEINKKFKLEIEKKNLRVS